MVSDASEDDFCSSEIKHGALAKYVYSGPPEHRELSWDRVLARKFYEDPKQSSREEWCREQINETVDLRSYARHRSLFILDFDAV